MLKIERAIFNYLLKKSEYKGLIDTERETLLTVIIRDDDWRLVETFDDCRDVKYDRSLLQFTDKFGLSHAFNGASYEIHENPSYNTGL